MNQINADLRGKQVGVVGKKDMGKSFFVNYLMSQIKGNYACFDPMREHTDYKPNDLLVRPTVRRGEEAIIQLKEFVEFCIENRRDFDYIVVDEINRFHSKNSELEGPVGDLIDFTAHYNTGFIWVARRPVQVHTDLQELSDYLFIFHLSGANDVRKLDNTSIGLGERVAALSPREFVAVAPDGYQTQDPISANLNHKKGI